jgi:outer membrane protein assembly factor BamE (lipoprotein component of BamABCDE complex)
MRSAAECALFLVILSGLCAGCIVVPIEKSECIIGTAIPKKEIRFIDKGVTTRSEVVQVLGPPTEWLEIRRILIYEWVSERDWFVGR